MRWVLVALLTAALLAGAWLLLGRDDADSDTHAGSDARTDVTGGDGPTLSGSAGRGLTAAQAPAGEEGTVVGRVTKNGVPAEAEVEARLLPLRFWRGSERGYNRARLRRPEPVPPPFARTRSASDGTFTLAGLPMGAIDLVARAADGSRAGGQVEIPAAGARIGAELALVAPGLTLRGLAITTKGAPAAGRVAAWPVFGDASDLEWIPGAAFGAADVGTDGTFEVTGLVPGNHAVRLFLPGGGVLLTPGVVLPSDERYEIVVPHFAATLRGRVLGEPGADPVERADVLLWVQEDAGSGPMLLSTTTSSDGRFSLEVPDCGLYVMVEAPGYPTHWQYVRRPAAEVVLRLPRLARVEGRVVALGDGRPAAGARVVANPGSENDVALADADGRYVLSGVAPGTALILVLGGGWATPGLGVKGYEHDRMYVTVPAAARVTHDLVAEPALRLEGHTRAADGSPVAGVVVCIDKLLRSGVDRDHLDTDTLPTGTVASDGEGRYAFPDLPPGASCVVAAWAPGQPPVVSAPTQLVSPGPTELDLQFPAPSTVEVRVVSDEDGRALPGAWVKLDIEGVPEGTGARAPAFTGPDGRASLGPVGPGPLSVSVRLGATATQATVAGAETPGGRTRHVEVRLALGRTIRGRVVLPDGNGAVGARVSLEPVTTEDELREVETRYDGSFLAEGVPAGRWVLHATRKGAESELQVAETGAEGVVLLLGPEPADRFRTAVVRVVDPAGRAVPKFEVNVRPSDRWNYSGLSGRVEVQVLRDPAAEGGSSGSRITVFNPSGDDDLPLDLAPVTITPIPYDREEIEVRLPTGSRIEGQVLLPDGAPAAAVSVIAALEGRTREIAQNAKARTDTRGRFRLVGLTDEAYELSVTAPRGCVTPAPTKVRPGSADTVIRLRVAVTCRLRVLGAEGRPAPGAEVEVRSPTHGARSETCDEEGRVVLLDLDPEADWSLHVNPEEHDALLPLAVWNWRPQDGDVRLERGRAIAGLVRSGAGTPVEGATVWIAGRDEETVVVTEADGKFRLALLKAGPQRVSVRAPRYAAEPEPHAPQTVLVEAGREDVVFTVDAGLETRVHLPEQPELDAPSASLSYRSSDGSWNEIQLGAPRARGLYVLQGLDAQTKYVFWMRARGGHCALADIDPRAGDVRVALQEGRSLSGRILNAGLAGRLRVGAVHSSGVTEEAQADREGRFAFAELPAGRWHVYAQDMRDGVEFVAEADVEAGGTVDLLLRPRK